MYLDVSKQTSIPRTATCSTSSLSFLRSEHGLQSLDRDVDPVSTRRAVALLKRIRSLLHNTAPYWARRVFGQRMARVL